MRGAVIAALVCVGTAGSFGPGRRVAQVLPVSTAASTPLPGAAPDHRSPGALSGRHGAGTGARCAGCFGRGGAAKPRRSPTARSQEPLRPAPRWARSGLSVPAFLAQQRAGALAEGPRAELIGGVVQAPVRLGPREVATLAHWEKAFQEALREAPTEPRLPVSAQVARFAGLRLGPSDLLRPDLALLASSHLRAPAGSGAAAASVDPAAALLVVEVERGRSSQERLLLYAVAGVRQLWLVDVVRGWTTLYRSPWRGLYRSRTLWYPGESVPLPELGGAEMTPLPRL